MKAKGKKPAAPRRSTALRSVPALAERGFPIVGVGASAGGLEAFTRLLKRLPADTGMGFVLVQHLDPQHESALTQILARATPMPVHEVTNNLRVQANHVYVIPPNTRLGMAHGILKLQPRVPSRVAPRSIDFFFEALAHDRCERSIGVILSGTATDGTLGLEAIKAEGGITFAQDGSARYDSMPRSAIGAGCVDFVLSPEAIAKELVQIARHPYVAGRAPEPLALPAGHADAVAPGGEKALPPMAVAVARRRPGSPEPPPNRAGSAKNPAIRKSCSSCAITPGWIFRTTSPPPFTGASRGARC
jgi:two-component system CheB/CheR fusion protein